MTIFTVLFVLMKEEEGGDDEGMLKFYFQTAIDYFQMH